MDGAAYDFISFESATVFEELFIVMDIERSPQAKKRIQECVDKGVCCNCQSGPIWRDGVCRKCLYRIATKTANLTRTKAAAVKAKMIRAGRLLVPQEIRFWKRKDDFLDRIIEEVA